MPGTDSTAGTIRRHEERLARDPTALAFALLGDAYWKAGRTGEAVTICREGLAQYPHYTTVRVILAKALAAEGRFDAALDEIRAILGRNPGDVACHHLAAEILRRQGDIDGAVRHLEMVIERDPGDRDAAALLGLLRASPAAEGEAKGLARVLRDDTFITVPFGSLCLDQGLTEEATQVFSRILRTDPGSVEARGGLEQALRARARRKG
jgi:tetratricopeptide (TPR) repeat protein